MQLEKKEDVIISYFKRHCSYKEITGKTCQDLKTRDAQNFLAENYIFGSQNIKLPIQYGQNLKIFQLKCS